MDARQVVGMFRIVRIAMLAGATAVAGQTRQEAPPAAPTAAPAAPLGGPAGSPVGNDAPTPTATPATPDPRRKAVLLAVEFTVYQSGVGGSLEAIPD